MSENTIILIQSNRPASVQKNDIESNQINTKVIDINDSEKYGTCIICGSILFALGVISCIITYFVYMFMSLCQTSYNEQKDICNESNIWLYLLLSLVINVIGSSSVIRSKYQDHPKSKLIIILQLIIGLNFLSWGCIELFGIKCVKDLKLTLLYTMLQVTVIINIVVGCILLIIGLGTCCATLLNKPVDI
jgi:hypothetical protein